MARFVFLFPYLSISSSLFIFTGLAIIRKASASEYGVLVAEIPSDTENFCIIYFKEFSSLPETKATAEFTPLLDRRKQDFCENVPNPDAFEGKFILASDEQNCSLAERAYSVQQLGGKGLLVAIPPGNVENVVVNSSADHGVNITVALISRTSVQRLEMMFPTVTVKMFSPNSFNFDFSLLIIWIMAVGAVAVGAFWSGIVRHALTCKMTKLPEMEENAMQNKSEDTTEESSLNISTVWIAAFVLCMGIMLLLLYFFFSYLVYIIIGLFVLASIISVYSCLEPLFRYLCSQYRLLEFQMCCKITVQQALRAFIAIALSVTWVVLRRESYSWVLQDLLGFAFSVNMLKSIRLPSLKICTLLLVLLFFYDIFFVFITPYFTQKGESVMVEVATGGTSQEQLPMVLRVPHFHLDPLTVCYQQYSLLGFGDILVPGLLISFCHGMDMLLKTKRRLYYITTVIAYASGLIITFVGLYLMTMPQPALLYLVPATLIPVGILSWARGELHIMWIGIKPAEIQADNSVDPSPQTNEDLSGNNSPSSNDPKAVVCDSDSLLPVL